MRVVDADALREHMVYDEVVGQYVPQFFIDRSPTLRCDGCKWWRDRHGLHGEFGVCHQGDIVFPDADTSPADYGCSLWEAK